MERNAKAVGFKTRFATLAVALSIGVSTQSMDAHGRRAGPASAGDGASQMPVELHGFWDLSPHTCRVSPEIESDSRIEIRARFVRGYEEMMEVSEVAEVSQAPLAWRIQAISSIAPAELQGAAIYVLSGDSLTIVDPQQARTYVRCEAVSPGGAS